jgi:hypothetical protein
MDALLDRARDIYEGEIVSSTQPSTPKMNFTNPPSHHRTSPANPSPTSSPPSSSSQPVSSPSSLASPPKTSTKPSTSASAVRRSLSSWSCRSGRFTTGSRRIGCRRGCRRRTVRGMWIWEECRLRLMGRGLGEDLLKVRAHKMRGARWMDSNRA